MAALEKAKILELSQDHCPVRLDFRTVVLVPTEKNNSEYIEQKRIQLANSKGISSFPDLY